MVMSDPLLGSPFLSPAAYPKTSPLRGPASKATTHPGGNSVALSDYAFALCVLMGTLVIPFTALYVVPRLKRGAVTKPVPVKVRQ